MSRNERKSPFWRSKSTTQTGRPGAARTAASASWRQTVVVPTPPLAPATAISWPPSAAPADSSPATRSRIVRDHCEAARTLPSSCSSESGSETTSRRPACIAARNMSGESSAAIRTSPTSGKLVAMSRATSSTGTAPSASWRIDDVDLEPPQRARQLLGVGDAVDDLAAPRPPGRAPTRSGRARRRRSRAGRGAGSSRVGPRVGPLALLERREVAGPPQREPDLVGEGLRLA